MGPHAVAGEITVGTEEQAGKTSVRVIRSIPELEGLRSTWVSWQHHPNCDIDRYLTVVRSRPEILRPHIIVISRDEMPNLILIARLETVPLRTRIGYRNLYRPSVRSLSVSYDGALGDLSSANARVLAQTLRKSLLDGEADVAWFNSLRVDSPLYRAVRKTSSFLCRDHFPDLSLHWRVWLPKSYEEFLHTLSSKTRNNLRRHRGRLHKAFGGRVSVRCLRQKRDLDQILSDTETVAAKTYQRGLGVGFANNAEERCLMSLALDREWLRSYIVYIRDTPCAFWNGLLYGKTFFTGTTGVDPSYREYGLGTFLLTNIFEDMCQNTAAEGVDFGFGDAQYKREFCDNGWQEASFYMFAPNLKGLELNALRTPMHAVTRLAQTILTSKVRARIKRVWRDHRTHK